MRATSPYLQFVALWPLIVGGCAAPIALALTIAVRSGRDRARIARSMFYGWVAITIAGGAVLIASTAIALIVMHSR